MVDQAVAGGIGLAEVARLSCRPSPFCWRSPVSESEECRAHDFSKCELVHSPGPIPERGWRAGADDGLSIWEMSGYQEAILVAEGT
jgi:hypothetical protein